MDTNIDTTETQDNDTESSNASTIAIAAIGVIAVVAVGGFLWRKFRNDKDVVEESQIDQPTEA